MIHHETHLESRTAVYGRPVSFNRPALVGSEMTYMQQAIANKHIAGNGPFSKACHALLEAELGVDKALLTTSCTDALEMAALLLDIQPGDEVIVPAYTFVSTANAFALRGAKIVFADIRPDTLNLDEHLLPELITPRTRAIVPVHYAGVACEMSAICELAQQHGISVVEDNAHGLFGTYHGRALGTFGALATQSFHETKNFICGEGGALLVNDPTLVARAEILREKGTDRSRFFRGDVDRYTWVDLGSSYLMSDLQAAFLLAQLEQREIIMARRRAIWQAYDTGLQMWAADNHIQTPYVPTGSIHPNHLYYLVFPTAADQAAFIAHMKRRDIQTVFHYQPLHLSEMGRRHGGRAGDCPVTESVSARLVRLPLYFDLTAVEQMHIIAAAQEFVTGVTGEYPCS